MSLWIELDKGCLTGAHRNILVGDLYRSPHANVVRFNGSFHVLLHKLSLENKWVVLTGDININLLDISPTTVAFSSYLTNYGFTCLITSPTRVTCTISTLIGHMWVKDCLPSYAEVFETDIVDHYVISAAF